MSKRQATLREVLPDLPNYHPDAADGVQVGASPAPGLTLRRVLRGHSGNIYRIAWSPQGRLLASPGDDSRIRLWEISSGDCVQTLGGDFSKDYAVTWSPDGLLLASGGASYQFRVWKAVSGENVFTSDKRGRNITSIAWSPDGERLANSLAGGKVENWDTHTWKAKADYLDTIHKISYELKWSWDGSQLACCWDDRLIRIWDRDTQKPRIVLEGHKDRVESLQWFKDGKRLVSSSADKTIRIWDTEQGRTLSTLEGHTDRINSISLSFDEKFLASKSWDNTVKLWNMETGECLLDLRESSGKKWLINLAFHPYLPILASLGEEDQSIRIWEIDADQLLSQSTSTSVLYTTAKLVLVGDSGVGKTGLGWRIAHKEFKEHPSTHGQQFWVIDELGKTRDDGTLCEAVLWDLAGQPDYRLVHSLFLDDVDTALLLFDPTKRQETLSGVDFWLNQLKQREKALVRTILVGARSDRGSATLTETELQAYCEQHEIAGGYLATSALEGTGLSTLMERIKTLIPWEEMTTTVTTLTFKRIKEFVLSLKEQPARKQVLVDPQALRARLEASDATWEFQDAEMMTAVGHLSNLGYVTLLRGSEGKQSILLAPDVLVNLAASIVLEARRNPRGLGVLEEKRLLAGDYRFPELDNLEEEEQETLLDAATMLFLEHNLCFRETFNNEVFLVFPSLINEKPPLDEGRTPEEGASYRIKGAVEHVYPSLVVLLGYTNTFTRTHQWQNQAQYQTAEGASCGFRQTENRDGEIELVLQYDSTTQDWVRLMFRGMFERFLSRRELAVQRYQPVVCPDCKNQLARNVVMAQLAKNKAFSFCHECGIKLTLPDPEPITRLSPKEEQLLDAQQAVAQRKTAFEAALVRVKSLLRDRKEAPSCFISYAWGIAEQERWVLQLAKDLQNAGISILFDKWHNLPGTSLSHYTDQILEADFVIVVGTPSLRQKYEATDMDPVVKAELTLINTRLRKPSKYGNTVIPALLVGEQVASFTPALIDIIAFDFRLEEYRFVNLFKLIWRLYELPFDNPLLEDLLESMHPN